MSTRSVIAIPNGDGWKGRYCHSDGYPSGVGETLVAALSKSFDGDLDAMIDKLVTSERIGWSSIASHDLTMPAEWREHDRWPKMAEEAFPGYHPNDYSAAGPQSYTARGETIDVDTFGDGTGYWITHDGDHGGTEWCYVLTPRGVMVFEHHYGGGWEGRGLVEWGDTLSMRAVETVGA